MSRVCLVAADRPLPLCDMEEHWTRALKLSERFRNPDLRGVERVISGTSLFRIQEHSYYRGAVDELELELKGYQYELEVTKDQWTLEKLTAYLKENLSSGEQVELWSLWIGNESIPPARYAGHLKDFDMDTLHQFLDAESICITITV